MKIKTSMRFPVRLLEKYAGEKNFSRLLANALHEYLAAVPEKPGGKNRKIVRFSIDPVLFERVKKIADEWKIPASAVIIEALERYADRSKI